MTLLRRDKMFTLMPRHAADADADAIDLFRAAFAKMPCATLPMTMPIDAAAGALPPYITPMLLFALMPDYASLCVSLMPLCAMLIAGALLPADAVLIVIFDAFYADARCRHACFAMLDVSRC